MIILKHSTTGSIHMQDLKSVGTKQLKVSKKHIFHGHVFINSKFANKILKSLIRNMLRYRFFILYSYCYIPHVCMYWKGFILLHTTHLWIYNVHNNICLNQVCIDLVPWKVSFWCVHLCYVYWWTKMKHWEDILLPNKFHRK